MSPFYIQLSENDTGIFRSFSTLLFKELTTRNQNYQKQIFRLLQVLLLRVERLKQNQSSVEVTSDWDFLLAVQFKKTIESNLHIFLTVEQCAEILGINTKKLTAISQQYLKDTPLSIIHQRKVVKAKRLLSNTSISIKEIAYELGFEQPTYFTNYFKKHTGFTPKVFLQQIL